MAKQVNRDVEQCLDSLIKEHLKVNIEELIDEEIETKIVIYDTSQKDTTGNYPIAAIVEQSNKRASNITTTTDAIKESEHSATLTDNTTEDVTEQATVKSNSWWQQTKKYLICVGIGALMIILLWFYLKFKI